MEVKVVLVLAGDTQQSENPNLSHSVFHGTNKGHLKSGHAHNDSVFRRDSAYKFEGDTSFVLL